MKGWAEELASSVGNDGLLSFLMPRTVNSCHQSATEKWNSPGNDEQRETHNNNNNDNNSSCNCAQVPPPYGLLHKGWMSRWRRSPVFWAVSKRNRHLQDAFEHSLHTMYCMSCPYIHINQAGAVSSLCSKQQLMVRSHNLACRKIMFQTFPALLCCAAHIQRRVISELIWVTGDIWCQQRTGAFLNVTFSIFWGCWDFLNGTAVMICD